MGQQLLFCVETNKLSRTDWTYIRAAIRKYYRIDNTISLKPIYMQGKNNYQSMSVRNQIKTATKEFQYSGNTNVIYCIDTDDWNRDPDRNRELSEITAYCEANHYDLVWFCRDIEEVFWGERIAASKKVDYASRFNRINRIDAVAEASLRQQVIGVFKSNILTVIDKYLAHDIETEQ